MKYSILAVGVSVALLLSPANVFAEEHFFDSGGTKIRYTVDGEGEPVILVHGYQASGDMNWRIPGVIRLLAKDHRVITIDNRGHGKSAEPGDDHYGIEMVHDVVRLMDHLQSKDAHFAGYSMGGMITIKLLTMHPERVRSAVIGGMGWYEGPSEATANDESDGGKYAKIARDFKELATTESEIKAIKTPLEVIVGTNDDGQLARVRRWQGVVPDLPVVYIDGATHLNCVLKPAFRESVRDFIAGPSVAAR